MGWKANGAPVNIHKQLAVQIIAMTTGQEAGSRQLSIRMELSDSSCSGSTLSAQMPMMEAFDFTHTLKILLAWQALLQLTSHWVESVGVVDILGAGKYLHS